MKWALTVYFQLYWFHPWGDIESYSTRNIGSNNWVCEALPHLFFSFVYCSSSISVPSRIYQIMWSQFGSSLACALGLIILLISGIQLWSPLCSHTEICPPTQSFSTIIVSLSFILFRPWMGKRGVSHWNPLRETTSNTKKGWNDKSS